MSKRIVRIEMDEQRLREWVEQAKLIMARIGSLRTYRRTISADGLSAFVWVAVLTDTPKPSIGLDVLALAEPCSCGDCVDANTRRLRERE